jgi:hypothetical protein
LGAEQQLKRNAGANFRLYHKLPLPDEGDAVALQLPLIVAYW